MHGERELLARAFAAIEACAGERAYRIVMLGDYVDRGPDSAGVIRLLRTMQQENGNVICLKGNHEAMMLKACDTGDHRLWLKNGGTATLDSYNGTISSTDLKWISTLPVHFSENERIYVHGGIAPNVALEDQLDEVCLWIREAFLRALPSELPCHVVHGHTPQWAGKTIAHVPERLPHRTNLDTAAFATGVLSIGVFETDRPGGATDLLQIRRPALIEWNSENDLD